MRIATLICLTVALSVSAARADIHAWKHHYCRDYCRSKHWPKPFIYKDRAACRAPFYGMVSKGWQRQTTLGEQHFRTDTHALTANGREKIRWILTSAPPQHRAIYFVGGNDQTMTDNRREAIQSMTRDFLPPGAEVSVEETHIRVEGWPADYVDMIDRKFRESTPPPRLPAPTGDDDLGG